MLFASRKDAGYQLADLLVRQAVRVDMVLGLPRGGVVVAVEVARKLQCPLDVIVVRKIGHPYHPEFAIGAMAEGGVTLLTDDKDVLFPLRKEEIDEVITRETLKLEDYESRFHVRGRPDLKGKQVLLVDDGIATGATTEAAVRSSRRQGASVVMVGAPVGSSSALQQLSRVADGVHVLVDDRDFLAVGDYYESFEQVSDVEVLRILSESRETT